MHPTTPRTPRPLPALALVTLLASFGTSAANVSLPALADAFAAPFSSVQWVVLGYLLAVTSAVAIVGRLGDLVGRRRLLGVGLGVFALASLASSTAPSLEVLVVGRVVQGLGGAVMMALSMALVGDAVPSTRTGAALGLLGTMSAVGTALGPAIGGAILDAFGWPFIFLMMVPTAMFASALVRRHVPEDDRGTSRTSRRFDLLGAGLLSGAMVAYAMAMTLERGHLGSLGVSLLIASGLGIVTFVAVESRVSDPIVRLGLFRDRAFGASLLASLLVATAVMTTLVVGPFYLSLTLGLTPAAVGLVMAAGPVVAAMTAWPSGRLVDKVGARRVALVGLGGLVSGTLALALAPESLGVLGYVLPVALLTGSYGLFQAGNNTSVLQGVSAGERGATSGLLNLSRNLGLVTGASVMGAIFSVAAGGGDVAQAAPTAVAAAMRTTFAATALALVLALGALLRVRAAPSPARAIEHP